MNPPLTVGWWNDLAFAQCGPSRVEPPVIASSANDTLTVEVRADLSVVIGVFRARLHVPRHQVRPLFGGLAGLDAVSLPARENGYHQRINDELSLEMQPDAAIVIVIGADDQPAAAIEVPGVQVERLKRTLWGIL